MITFLLISVIIIFVILILVIWWIWWCLPSKIKYYSKEQAHFEIMEHEWDCHPEKVIEDDTDDDDDLEE